MGYRLNGIALERNELDEMISSAVTKGTIQLLPSGQLIVLMADHQTTGGYPRLGHVISADIPKLAQASAGTAINFEMTDHITAEQAF
jgi:antagonist of KipI